MRSSATSSSIPWSIYLMEAALLGLFMISACAMTVTLEHPSSILHAALPSATFRRALMGLAMGLTAIALLRSHWAKRTGAHMNPAVTLAVLRMQKISPRDAVGYVTFQFLGAAGGVGLVHLLTFNTLSHTSVHFAATTPSAGFLTAWLAEFTISFLLMALLTALNRSPCRRHFTSYIAGLLIALYIFIEAPISGMSMNPARTLGSALWARDFTALWIYFTAPPLAMLLAVEIQRLKFPSFAICCKPIHCHITPCHCKCDCLRVSQSLSTERTESHVHAI